MKVTKEAPVTDLTWQQKAAERKANREKAKRANTLALLDAGISYTVLDHGWHLRIQARGEVIDFMPGPGSWSIFGKRSKKHGHYRGVPSLVQYVNHGTLPSKNGGIDD